jgi:stress response protein YsnF
MPESLPTGHSTIPIVEEHAHVVKTVVQTGAIRVRVRTASRTEVIDEPVLIRGFSIGRVTRNEVVEARRPAWTEGEVMVVPVYEEVVVKQTVLVEEIRLTPTVSMRHEAQRLDLTSETAVYERQDHDGSWHEVPFSELRATGSE